MDKARAAATDLTAKADKALSSSGLGGPGASGGDPARYLRDLGVLAYLEANGRPAPPEDRERVMGALREMETRGAIGSLTLQTSATPPSGTVPPPPGGAVPPPPGGTVSPPAPQAGEMPPPAQSTPTTPAPPPPSWMTKDDGSNN